MSDPGLCEHGYELGFCYPCRHGAVKPSPWVAIAEPFIATSGSLCSICSGPLRGRLVVKQRQLEYKATDRTGHRFVHVDCQ